MHSQHSRASFISVRNNNSCSILHAVTVISLSYTVNNLEEYEFDQRRGWIISKACIYIYIYVGHGYIGSYRWIGPLVVQLPPVQQLLPGLLGKLAFLLPLGELLPEAAQVAAVLPQKLVLELLVLGAGIDLFRTASVLVILGRPGAFTVTLCRCQLWSSSLVRVCHHAEL